MQCHRFGAWPRIEHGTDKGVREGRTEVFLEKGWREHRGEITT